MATTGITRLDQLLAGVGEPIGLNEPPHSFGTGVVQDLLKCWFPDTLPLADYWPVKAKVKSPAPLFFAPVRGNSPARYGVYDQKTHDLVAAFQRKWNSIENVPLKLPEDGRVDALTLKVLATPGAKHPFATPGYFVFNRSLKFSHTLKAMTLIASRECLCNFTTPNPNNDGAGLSCGIFHWAQRPGRLYELIDYFFKQAPDALSAIFGDQPDSQNPAERHFRIKKVLAQLKKKFAALYNAETAAAHNETSTDKRKAGDSKDRTLEFANPDPGQPNWLACFTEMLGTDLFQKLMLELGLATIQRMYDNTFEGYPQEYRPLAGEGVKQWSQGKLKSEQAVIFALDMVNQHGNKVRTWGEKFLADHPNATEEQLVQELRTQAGDFWVNKPPLPTTPAGVAAREKKRNEDHVRRDFYLKTWFIGAADYLPDL